MTRIRQSTVLVTGGAIGIGRLMAEGFLARGAARVVLWDINETTLQATAAELRAKGHTVDPYVVDVADPAAIAVAAGRVLAEVGPVDIVVNNAGIVVGKSFVDHSTGEIENSVRINVLGPMHVTAAFLPTMISRRTGHVVNISSAAGLLPNPDMSVYASSKWAVLGWSESLRLELERVDGALRVTTVTPSYIDTGMFAGVRAPLLTPIMQPTRIVDAILRGVENDKILVREPFMVKLLPFLRGVMPARVFDFVAGRLFGVYTTMKTFHGRVAAPADAAERVPTAVGKGGK